MLESAARADARPGVDAKARILRKGGAYRYEAISGDPLKLGEILPGLTPDAEGYHHADALLAATATHTYPAPLQRLWRAHLGLVENPPDVILSLADGFFSGAKSFGGSVRVASTHGSLNARNSTAFIFSTIGRLPEVLRSADVPSEMQKLVGAPWPLDR